jgi:hypothetical protein
MNRTKVLAVGSGLLIGAVVGKLSASLRDRYWFFDEPFTLLLALLSAWAVYSGLRAKERRDDPDASSRGS